MPHWQAANDRRDRMTGSNSLDFPRPAGPRPETQPAGYKPKGVIQRLFPSNLATMLLRPMSRRLAATAPPEGRTMEMVRFFRSPGSLNSAHFW